MSTQPSDLVSDEVKPVASNDTKNVSWYTADEDVPELEPSVYDIFVNYSHLPPETIRAHVLKKVSNISAEAMSQH